MKIENLKEGQVVYSLSRHKMGNTTMRTTSVHELQIKRVDALKGTVMASWNHNEPRLFFKNSWSKWRKGKPILISSGWSQRLATREEIKAMKAKGKEQP